MAIDRVPIPPPDVLQVERIGPLMNSPWSIVFLPDGSMLVTEKHRGIRRIDRNGTGSGLLNGGPSNVFQHEDSGLLDIVLDPDFETNETVYVAFSEGTEEANRTAIWKGQFDGTGLSQGRVIFRVDEAKKGPGHPGGRMLFLDDKTLLLTVGDGYDYKAKAQDPTSHLGKVLRLTREGSVPLDNPFVGRKGYAPEIWTLGHRNIQGLAFDAESGTIWSHEHGPRGGDEINKLQAGKNYGWPITTSGIDYDGTVISNRAHATGIISPTFVWAPSIAPSGLALYRGDAFPELHGRLLIGGLAARSISKVRIHPQTGLLAEEARLLGPLKERIRDIRISPQSDIYFLTDGDRGGLYRVLAPSEQLRGPIEGQDRSIRDLAFLLGSWRGESEFISASPPERTIEMTCQPALKGTYIECNMTSTAPSGRSTVHRTFYNYDDRAEVFHTRLLESSWGTETAHTMALDGASGAYVGRFPVTDAQGRQSEEFVSMSVAPDGKMLALRTYLRAPNHETWTLTHRSTLTKI